jgi:hypothetical protein
MAAATKKLCGFAMQIRLWHEEPSNKGPAFGSTPEGREIAERVQFDQDEISNTESDQVQEDSAILADEKENQN